MRTNQTILITLLAGSQLSDHCPFGYLFLLQSIYESRHEKPTFWFPTWSDTNRAAQPQKIARGLKFRIKVVEGLYYTCSENKGADQLRGYREADLVFVFAYESFYKS